MTSLRSRKALSDLFAVRTVTRLILRGSMLLDEIVSLLSNTESSLTEALLKMKVLMHQIGKKELAEWINYELNGYAKDAELPNYRVLSANLMGNVSNAAWRMQDRPLPTAHLKDNYRDDFCNSRMFQSLSVIEQLSKGETVARELPPEFYGMLNKGLSNGFQVERAWCSTPGHQVQNVLVQVRSRLLDFVLELKDNYDESGQDTPVKEALKDVDTEGALRRAIFGPIGDHATIIIGDNNDTKTAVLVEQGNLQTLETALAKIGVKSDEMKTLSQAIEDDKKDGKSGFEDGAKASGWLLNFVKGAGKAGLKVGTDVAVSTVTQALKGYYGIH